VGDIVQGGGGAMFTREQLKSHFVQPTQYIIYFELNMRKKTYTFRMVFTISNVLPAIKHILDKLGEF
jgi:hypothetical protein